MAFADDDCDIVDQLLEQLLEHMLETWELEIGIEIEVHYQRLLEKSFAPIMVTEKDLAEHPNMSMIVNYNLFMRDTFFTALKHVNTFLAQSTKFQKKLARENIKKVENVDNSTTSASSVFEFIAEAPKRSSQPKISAKNSTLSKKSSNSLKPMGTLFTEKFLQLDSSYVHTKKKSCTINSSQRTALAKNSTEKSKSQPYSEGHIMQEKIDAITMYTHSLISDQIGNPRQSEV